MNNNSITMSNTAAAAGSMGNTAPESSNNNNDSNSHQYRRPAAVFSLRPATPSDVEFLCGIREITMRGYFEKTFGTWDEIDQRERFAPHELKNIQILLVSGDPAGLVHVERLQHEIFLQNIQFSPKFQNRGIGTMVFRSLMAESVKSGLAIRLKVLKENHPARRLYDRLGFTFTSESNHSHLWIQWNPIKAKL